MNPNTESHQKDAYVYMVECRDGSLYTGWTSDAEQRVRVHNSGQGAKYTRSRRPVTLVYLERIEEKSAAMKREAAIKKLKPSQKRQLIESERNLVVSLKRG